MYKFSIQLSFRVGKLLWTVLKAYKFSETKGFFPWVFWQPRQAWFSRTATVWSLFQQTWKQQSSEDMIGGTSIVFSQKAVVDEAFIRD